MKVKLDTPEAVVVCLAISFHADVAGTKIHQIMVPYFSAALPRLFLRHDGTTL